MARISLDPPRTLSYRLAARFSRRRYGTVLDPVAAVAHNARRSASPTGCSSSRWSGGASWTEG